MTTTAEARATALQVRFDHLIRQMRLVEAQTPATARPKVHEVIDELVRIRRDLSGLEGDLEPAPVPRPAASLHNLVRANGSRHAAKQHDGQRHCPKHDDGEGVWLPVDQFTVKNKTTGALRSWCDACTKAYQRERYVRTTATTVVVELHEDDFCVGRACPGCGVAFEAGQRVIGKDLAHEGCAA